MVRFSLFYFFILFSFNVSAIDFGKMQEALEGALSDAISEIEENKETINKQSSTNQSEKKLITLCDFDPHKSSQERVSFHSEDSTQSSRIEKNKIAWSIYSESKNEKNIKISKGGLSSHCEYQDNTLYYGMYYRDYIANMYCYEKSFHEDYNKIFKVVYGDNYKSALKPTTGYDKITSLESLYRHIESISKEFNINNTQEYSNFLNDYKTIEEKSCIPNNLKNTIANAKNIFSKHVPLLNKKIDDIEKLKKIEEAKPKYPTDKWGWFDYFYLYKVKKAIAEAESYKILGGTQSDYNAIISEKVGYGATASKLIEKYPNWTAEDIYLEVKNDAWNGKNADKEYIAYLHKNNITESAGYKRLGKIQKAFSECKNNIKNIPPTKRPKNTDEYCNQEILKRNINI